MEAMANSNKKKSNNRQILSAQAFLDSACVARRVVQLEGLEQAYAQDDPATSVMYIQEGKVKLSVVNEAGKEAIVAILGPGDFFGEGCLAGSLFARGRRPRSYPRLYPSFKKTK
jgi:CRP/FNR family cyclic AMP-dependent transcriptional regulator